MSVVTDETSAQTLSQQSPSSPSFTMIVDQLFRSEDPRLMACLTADLNNWWMAMGLTGRSSASDEDLRNLFRRFHLTLSCLPERQGQPLPRRTAISEFAPKPGARSIEEAAVRAIKEAETDPAPAFLQRAREADRDSALLGPAERRTRG